MTQEEPRSRFDHVEPSQGPSAKRSIPTVDTSVILPRVKQVQWDHYYMEVALTVRTRANCLGARVGAVLVLDNRIISTGFNGTPAGFTNCLDGGCVRCRERELADRNLVDEITEPELATGPKQLDLCICVHAEANAVISAARFGNRTEGATLYATHKPCFACVKEAYQAGIKRVVWLYDWDPSKSPSLRRQYKQLAEHLSANNPRNFEQLHPQQELVEGTSAQLRPPVLDSRITTKDPSEPITDDGVRLPDTTESGVDPQPVSLGEADATRVEERPPKRPIQMAAKPASARQEKSSED